MSTVYFERTEDRAGFVKGALRAHKAVFEEARGVLVKPNVVSWEPYSTTTHPDTLRATLEALEGIGTGYMVADGPAFDAGNPAEILGSHPLNQVCKELNTTLANLYTLPKTAIKTPRGFKLEVHRTLLRSSATLNAAPPGTLTHT